MSPYNTPVTLEGRWTRLEPLTLGHAGGIISGCSGRGYLAAHARSDSITAYDVRVWVQDALDMQARSMVLPFAIIHCASGQAIGSTRYLDISAHDRHVEIGWTWLGKDFWRTPLNTEGKYLLLKHAFETLGCIRVSLKTDLRNERSQRGNRTHRRRARGRMAPRGYHARWASTFVSFLFHS